MALLLHAVIPTATEVDGGDEAVQVLALDDRVAVVTTEVDGRVRPDRASLRRHARVIDASAQRGPALPLRFGHVVDDADELRSSALAGRLDRLADRLDAVRDRVETRVRVDFIEPAILARIGERPEVRAGRGRRDRESRIELGIAVSRALEQQRTSVADAVADALYPLADDLTRHERSGEMSILDVSLLHRPDDLDRVVDALDDVLDPSMVTAEVAGPLAPYSFAEVDGWD